MNAFYERLNRFGALVHEVSRTGEHIEDMFTVVHPGHPVVSQTRRTTPKLEFEQNCPKPIRRQVRQILKQAFRQARNPAA